MNRFAFLQSGDEQTSSVSLTAIYLACRTRVIGERRSKPWNESSIGRYRDPNDIRQKYHRKTVTSVSGSIFINGINLVVQGGEFETLRILGNRHFLKIILLQMERTFLRMKRRQDGSFFRCHFSQNWLYSYHWILHGNRLRVPESSYPKHDASSGWISLDNEGIRLLRETMLFHSTRLRNGSAQNHCKIKDAIKMCRRVPRLFTLLSWYFRREYRVSDEGR